MFELLHQMFHRIKSKHYSLFLVCGKPVDKQEITKLVGDSNKIIMEYPWTVLIYMKFGRIYDMVASGYLVSENKVITGKDFKYNIIKYKKIENKLKQNVKNKFSKSEDNLIFRSLY